MKIFKKCIYILLDLFILFIAIYFILGYINFKKISNNEKPIMLHSHNSYNLDNRVITVYDFIIYKIVREEVVDKNITLNLKLWFMEDV